MSPSSAFDFDIHYPSDIGVRMQAFSALFGGLMKRTTVVSGGIRQLIPKVRSWWWDEDESGLKEQRMPKFDKMTDNRTVT
jgi:hypothetical protein